MKIESVIVIWHKYVLMD